MFISSPRKDNQGEIKLSESKSLNKSLTFCFASAESTTSKTDRSNSPLDNLMSLEGNWYRVNNFKDDSTIICERNQDVFQTHNESKSQFQFPTQSESPILTQTQK